ncbi:glycosyltransferase 87 family protein [uncultured Methylobacterium sp.]|uniref:glycosyltransferase 87 family protein n=1 Tax=uncultured Methylobacterium sp. TaxID=157278 RepID=UPI0035CA053D
MRAAFRSPTARLASLGGALALLMIGALALHVPGADTVGTPTRANLFVAVLALGVALYLAAIRLVLRADLPRSALWLVLGLAVLMRMALLPSLPFLSSDIYRYVWDGQVQAAGINPYRYLPVDPALEHLRDPAVFPLINRATYARTIYPPAAEAVFGLVGRASASVTGMKVAMLGFEVVAVMCLLRLLSLSGLPRERIAIYAWNPLVLWSFACDGHVDAVAIGLLGLALLVRARRRDGWAGAILAGAVLVKFLPIVVAPAFLRRGRFRAPALAGAAVVAALYLPYLSAGRDLFGFLGAYGSEEGYDTGAGFWLVAGLSHLVPLPAFAGRAYALAVAVGFGALALWIVRRRTADASPAAVALCRDTAILAACATAAANPHYAWYYAWLAVPATVAPIPAVIWLSAAPVLFLIDPFNERFLWPALVFVPAAALALRSVVRHRPAVPIPAKALEGTA